MPYQPTPMMAHPKSEPQHGSSAVSQQGQSASKLDDIDIEAILGRFPEEIVERIIIHLLSDYSYTMSIFAERFSPNWEGWNPATRGLLLECDYRRAEIYTASRPGRQGTYETTVHPINTMAHMPGRFSISKPDMHWRMFSKISSCQPEAYQAAKDELYRKSTLIILPKNWTVNYSTMPTQNTASFYQQLSRMHVHDRDSLRHLPFCKVDSSFDREKALVGYSTQKLSNGESVPTYTLLRHLMLGSTKRIPGKPQSEAYNAESEAEWQMDADREFPPIFYAKLAREQAAWAFIDWEKLSKLETLHINFDHLPDLIAAGKITMDMVRAKTEYMCRHLNLELLVIYGLKTGRQHYVRTRDLRDILDGGVARNVPFDFSISEIEGSEKLEHLDQVFTNWIPYFKGALRPGGKLILLDECEDEEYDWSVLFESGRFLKGRRQRYSTLATRVRQLNKSLFFNLLM